MSQIATRNDVNSKCKGSMTSGVDCPTKEEILSTHLVGVNGTYGDNECVKIEDLEVGPKYKSVRVIVNSGSGVNIEWFNIIPDSGDTSIGVYVGDLGYSSYDDYRAFNGDSSNNRGVKVELGWFNTVRYFSYYDDCVGDLGTIGRAQDFGHIIHNDWNTWVNNVSHIEISVW